MKIFGNFLEKMSSFWQFFSNSNGNFPEGQVMTDKPVVLSTPVGTITVGGGLPGRACWVGGTVEQYSLGLLGFGGLGV